MCRFSETNSKKQAMQALKDRLCTALCLVYHDCTRLFHLEVGFSEHCLSAKLYQLHDQDKRIVAHTSKTLAPPGLNYMDCEKALLTTAWVMKHFASYSVVRK